MKILTAVKHLFIPHEHNEYKPHFFREISIALLVIVTVFFLGVSAGTSYFIHRTVLGANITASVLIDLTNESRLAFNETPLVRNELLDKAAELKAKDMVAHEYFSHTSPDGVTPWYWFKQAGYVFLYAGENLAINFTDASAVRDAWLASPKHRENLLDIRFKEIGMATLDGVYKDGPAIYVVQLFGTPARTVTFQPEGTESFKEDENLSEPAVATGTPEIKGESSEGVGLKLLASTQDFAVVKNTEAESAYVATSTPKYSTWFGRLIFGGSYYIQVFYTWLLAIVAVALVLMVAIEIRRQHWRHIAYGLAVLLVILLALFINQAFF